MSEATFHTNLLQGYCFKDLLVVLLDASGYEVYPYGYESFIAPLKRKIYESPESLTTRRVRSAPDLLVYHSEDKVILLVEVKSRNLTDPGSVGISNVSLYQKYWPESILVVVINSGSYLYAQQVRQLKPVVAGKHGDDFTDFNLEEDFQPLPAVFKHLDVSSLEDFKRRVPKLFGVFA